MYAYNDDFQELTVLSRLCARRIVAALLDITTLHSVLDVGCARGTWLAEWQTAGCEDIVGLDGPYIAPSTLEIGKDRFVVTDLTRPISLGRRFDIAQCLEVAEHLPKERAASLVADLTSHASMVLFSAAPPGQGGEHHINEQPYGFWQDLFFRNGFVAIDCLRPLLQGVEGIPHWYRYNLLLYASAEREQALPPSIRRYRIPNGTAVPDISPPLYRLRKRLIACLPVATCTQLAKLNARLATRRKSGQIQINLVEP